MTTTRSDCIALDRDDPLRSLRDDFALPKGVIYLDGNSLGALPKATAGRIRELVEVEWGRDLIKSWNSVGWIDLAPRIGDRIAALVGAGPGELTVGDSTSVNLYKVLSVAAALQASTGTAMQASPGTAATSNRRHRIVSERSNFPTDLYIADTIARQHGLTLELVDADDLATTMDDSLAILMLTHVNYRTGRMHAMTDVTRAAHAAGALVVWDLAHSAGAVPVDLKAGGDDAAAADFAIGCGYKYLNGGPGAPAFVWAHPRQIARMDREQIRQPLSGWLGHAAPFEFTTDYRAAAGIQRFVCGTPPVLSLAALECGLAVFSKLDAHGGIAALRAKSLALTASFIEVVEQRCAGHGLSLVTPREPALRGSQVSFSRPDSAFAVMQALIERGVIGDFRAPDVLRFGFTPLYTRFVDVWDAAEQLQQVLESGEWQEPRFHQRSVVT